MERYDWDGPYIRQLRQERLASINLGRSEENTAPQPPRQQPPAGSSARQHTGSDAVPGPFDTAQTPAWSGGPWAAGHLWYSAHPSMYPSFYRPADGGGYYQVATPAYPMSYMPHVSYGMSTAGPSTSLMGPVASAPPAATTAFGHQHPPQPPYTTAQHTMPPPPSLSTPQQHVPAQLPPASSMYQSDDLRSPHLPVPHACHTHQQEPGAMEDQVRRQHEATAPARQASPGPADGHDPTPPAPFQSSQNHSQHRHHNQQLYPRTAVSPRDRATTMNPSYRFSLSAHRHSFAPSSHSAQRASPVSHTPNNVPANASPTRSASPERRHERQRVFLGGRSERAGVGRTSSSRGSGRRRSGTSASSTSSGTPNHMREHLESMGFDPDNFRDDVLSLQVARGMMTTKTVASISVLQSLRVVSLAELPAHEKTCVICYNDFGVKTPEGVTEVPVRLPKCKHVFGDKCIKKWLEDSATCPYCRDTLPSEPRFTWRTQALESDYYRDVFLLHHDEAGRYYAGQPLLGQLPGSRAEALRNSRNAQTTGQNTLHQRRERDGLQLPAQATSSRARPADSSLAETSTTFPALFRQPSSQWVVSGSSGRQPEDAQYESEEYSDSESGSASQASSDGGMESRGVAAAGTHGGDRSTITAGPGRTLMTSQEQDNGGVATRTRARAARLNLANPSSVPGPARAELMISSIGHVS